MAALSLRGVEGLLWDGRAPSEPSPPLEPEVVSQTRPSGRHPLGSCVPTGRFRFWGRFEPGRCPSSNATLLAITASAAQSEMTMQDKGTGAGFVQMGAIEPYSRRSAAIVAIRAGQDFSRTLISDFAFSQVQREVLRAVKPKLESPPFHSSRAYWRLNP